MPLVETLSSLADLASWRFNKSHVTSILAKLDAADHTGAVSLAISSLARFNPKGTTRAFACRFPAPSPETWPEPSCSTDTASQRGANRESGRRSARAQPGTRVGACGPHRVQPRTDHHFQLRPSAKVRLWKWLYPGFDDPPGNSFFLSELGVLAVQFFPTRSHRPPVSYFSRIDTGRFSGQSSIAQFSKFQSAQENHET